MAKAAHSTTEMRSDLAQPWEAPARLLHALASFDRIVAQIDGAVLGGVDQPTMELRQAA